MRRSSTERDKVSPWQPLKVVAYANRRGICFRETVNPDRGGVNVNVMRGMQ
jgi:hypothetical protein